MALRKGANLYVVSIGLPGRFSEWCDRVIARLLGWPGPSVILQQWPAQAEMLNYVPLRPVLDQLAVFAITADAAEVVIGSRYPDASLRDALAKTDVPFLLTLDNPRGAVGDLLQDSGAEPKLATRAVANSCALLMAYGSLPRMLLLHGDGARGDLTGTVMTIARHFGLGVDTHAAEAIAAELRDERPAYPAGGEAWAARIPEESKKTVGGALSGYEECFAGQGLGRFVWNRDLFAVSDPHRRATDVLDISDGRGPLIYGPCIHLPAGMWTARIHLGVSGEAARYAFLLDVFVDGRQLAAAHFQPNAPGIHVADLHFSLGDPSGQGVEVRVTPVSPAAKGRIALGYVVLSPPGMHHPEADIEWEEQFRGSAEL